MHYAVREVFTSEVLMAIENSSRRKRKIVEYNSEEDSAHSDNEDAQSILLEDLPAQSKNNVQKQSPEDLTLQRTAKLSAVISKLLNNTEKTDLKASHQLTSAPNLSKKETHRSRNR